MPLSKEAVDLSKEAVQDYHDLLHNTPGLIERTKAELWQQLEKERFVFGGRMLSPYLRPHFITREHFDRVTASCQDFWKLVARVGELSIHDRQLQDYLGLTEDERRLIAIDPKFSGVSRLSRLDSFLCSDSYQFVELNAETPAGVAYSDVASHIFAELEVMQLFSNKYKLSRLSNRQHLLNSLLAAYQEFSGNGPHPQIAIVDFKGLPTQREFELVQEYFENCGYKTIIADPRDLEFSSGRLRKGDFIIDIVYKRLLVNEFLEKGAECQSLLKACEAQAVCMVNSFRGKLAHKKLLFGIFTDERFAHFFSQAEKKLLERHVPWTRRLEPRKTIYKGEEIELLEFVRSNRDILVLKPNDDYGGKGIFIGWQGNQEEWNKSIETALAADYLVQERVATSRESFPHIKPDGTIDFCAQLVDLDPLLYDGQVGGAFARLSHTELANVTAGGGMVPVFIIEGHQDNIDQKSRQSLLS